MASHSQSATTTTRRVLAVDGATTRVTALPLVVLTLFLWPTLVTGGPVLDPDASRVNLQFIETKGGKWEHLEQSTAPLMRQRIMSHPINNEEVKLSSVPTILASEEKSPTKTPTSETGQIDILSENAPQTWRKLGLESASLARDSDRSQDQRGSSLNIKRNFRSMCPEDCKCGLITGVTCYSSSDTDLLPEDFPVGIKVLTLYGYKNIGEELERLTDLKELSIYDGNVTILPPLPGSLTHLRIINSNLKGVNSLHSLNHLLALNLAHNNITEADFSALTNLLSLDLSNNPLEKLPYLPTSLTILDLHNTDLQAQPTTWDVYLPNLRQLVLAGMKMRQPPYLILPKLEYLDMSHSEILVLPYLSSLPNLKVINLSHVNISDAHSDYFRGALELEKIDLSFTNLSMVANKVFANNPKLKEILLHHSSLKSIGDYTFSELWNLEKLIVSSNPNLLSIDDKALATLKKLKVFDISNTLTRMLPYSIRDLNLTHLLATNVNFLCDCHAYWLPSYLSSIIDSETHLSGVLPVRCADGVERSIRELEDHIYDQDCIAPDIISTPDVTLRRGEGKTALLECNATGFPHPNVIWISPKKEYYSHEHIDLQPWFSEKFKYVIERITYFDAESMAESKIQPLKSGQLLIQNMTRDDVGLYRCIAVNALASVMSTTSLWLTIDDMQAFELETLLFGLACAMTFLLTTLIVQLIRYIMDRMGWECCCCRDRLSSRAMRVKKLLESIEAYKSQQLDRLKDNYNSQVVTIKEGCYQQMERLSESYSQQCKNLQSIKDYSAQQLTTARDQYVEQVNRVRDYSASQMNKVSENYVFQRQRVRKFSAHQLFKLRETYKYQQKTLNKILENIPDLYLQNCRTGGSCNRTDSIIFDDEIHGIDAYYRLDFLGPIGMSNESSEDMFYTPSSTLTKAQRNVFIHQHMRNHSNCSASTTEYQEAAQSWATNTPTIQSPKTLPSHLTTTQIATKYRPLKHSRSLSISVCKPAATTNKAHAPTHRRTHSASIQTRSSIAKVHSSPLLEKPQRPRSVDLTEHTFPETANVFIEADRTNDEQGAMLRVFDKSGLTTSGPPVFSVIPSVNIEPQVSDTDMDAIPPADAVSVNENLATSTSDVAHSLAQTGLQSVVREDSDTNTLLYIVENIDINASSVDGSETKKDHANRKKSLSREGSKEMENRFALPSVTEDQEPTSSSTSSNQSHL